MKARFCLLCLVGAVLGIAGLFLTSGLQAQVGLAVPRSGALGLSSGAPEAVLGYSYADHAGHAYHAPHSYYLKGSYSAAYPYGWYSPWLRVPQTQNRKAHRAAVYQTPRLGLQYNYPFAALQYPKQGLDVPVETDTPLIPVQTDTYVPPPSPVDLSLGFLKAGRYAEAGRVLSEELKQPEVSLDTYVAIAELLVATSNYKDAARVFLHGLNKADDLRGLDAVNVAADFPTVEEFTRHLEAIRAQGDTPRMQFLAAALALLSGDAAGLDAMLTLQENKEVGSAAKKMYLHFLGWRFQESDTAPAESTESSGNASTE